MTTVRIKEVAKLARVSTATVSHVINKTRFVSDDTKRKVLYAIERVGYTPNIHARNLASGQSRTLGLIISDITNPFFPDLVKSIQERALELGYDVIVLNTNYEPERDSRYVQRLLELRVLRIPATSESIMKRAFMKRLNTFLSLDTVRSLSSVARCASNRHNSGGRPSSKR